METARESPDSETKETSEGLNFHVAGRTRTPAASWRPAVRLVITTPTCSEDHEKGPYMGHLLFESATATNTVLIVS